MHPNLVHLELLFSYHRQYFIKEAESTGEIIIFLIKFIIGQKINLLTDFLECYILIS